MCSYRSRKLKVVNKIHGYLSISMQKNYCFITSECIFSICTPRYFFRMDFPLSASRLPRYEARSTCQRTRVHTGISVTTPWVFSQDLGFCNSTLDFLRTLVFSYFTEMVKSILSSCFNINRDNLINHSSIY